MRHVSIPAALKFAAKNPTPPTDVYLDLPTHYLISRRLWQLANNPDFSQRGSVTRAGRAQKIILDRLVGRRRSGSAPAMKNSAAIQFADLTKGVGDAESEVD